MITLANPKAVIVTPEEPGEKLVVTGKVTDANGQPIAGALIYVYQTSAKGWYAADRPHILEYEGDIRHARLFGYLRTGSDGRYTLRTIRPVGYPNSDLPAHIHYHIIQNGRGIGGGEIRFDDDPRMTLKAREESIRDRYLIVKVTKDRNGVQHCVADMKVKRDK